MKLNPMKAGRPSKATQNEKAEKVQRELASTKRIDTWLLRNDSDETIENFSSQEINNLNTITSPNPVPRTPEVCAQSDSSSEEDDDFQECTEVHDEEAHAEIDDSCWPSMQNDPYLEEKLNQIESQIDAAGIPDVYKAGQFLVRPQQPVFALLQNKQPDTLYQRDIFVWLPHLLLPKGEKFCCYKCEKPVQNSGYAHNPRARKVVSLSSWYYLYTCRYKCPNKECDVQTFYGTKDKFLEKMPVYLQRAFPAVLSHRGALDKELASLLRPLFVNGFGGSLFKELIEELHAIHYDNLDVMRLSTYLIKRAAGSLNNTIENHFKPRKHPMGYRDFVPSGGYFAAMQQEATEKLRMISDAQQALIPICIGKADLSFKLAEHFQKSNGVPPFCGLLTILNEHEEIAGMVYVPTKSNKHWQPLLQTIFNNHKACGYDIPKVFYTDNVGQDVKLLQDAFSSNAVNSSIIQEEGEEVPQAFTAEDINIVGPLKSAEEINESVENILKELDSDISKRIVVGIDCEWSVKQGQPYSRGVDLLQIAFEEKCILIKTKLLNQICPVKLKSLLESTRVLKTGKSVSGDISRLTQSYSNLDESKLRATSIDLGKLCKERNIVEKATVSLSKLSRVLLGKILDKSERLTDWSKELSAKQIQYAAIDAHVSLLIYNSAIKFAKLGSSFDQAEPGDLFTLLGRDRQLETARVEFCNYSNTRRTKAVVKLDKIVSSVSNSEIPSRLWKINENVTVSTSLLKPITRKIRRPFEVFETIDDPLPYEETNNNDFFDATDYSVITQDELDAGSTALLNVKDDAFHFIQRIMRHCPKSHSVFGLAAHKLSQAIFQVSKVDIDNIKAYVSTVNEDLPKFLRDNPTIKRKAIRRVIPEPEELAKRFAQWVETFKHAIDEKTGTPLFTSNCNKAIQQAAKDIINNHLSDPPQVPLYAKLSKSKHGLQLYRCFRGTSSLEGGVHRQIHRKLGNYNHGIKSMDSFLLEFRLRHNLETYWRNRLAKKYFGHYDLLLTAELQALYLKAEMPLRKDLMHVRNPLMYVGYEVYRQGISVIDAVTAAEHAMCTSSDSSNYLARCQKLAKPSLPFTNEKEYLLLSTLLTNNPGNDSSDQYCMELSRLFNTSTDVDSYKLCQHIRQGVKTLKARQNERSSARLLELTNLAGHQLPASAPIHCTVPEEVVIPQLSIIQYEAPFQHRLNTITETPVAPKKKRSRALPDNQRKRKKKKCTICGNEQCDRILRRGPCPLDPASNNTNNNIT